MVWYLGLLLAKRVGQFDGVHSETLSAARVTTNVVSGIKIRRQESRAL
ncbi:hypothetical protein EJ73_01165 [Hoylesella shahii DSM 15611 = JCM 12083]|uniref:Uncharacterized protein n=1 Tax=Hoylesella shahii DSM 15611 = JCM 12083 TaxID=1122991 RepID=A0A318I0S6_9BACT|nr:hypothetical protein EJ73_01165 [Hoylesella shahii DSM 15611 = JCM 12083]